MKTRYVGVLKIIVGIWYHVLLYKDLLSPPGASRRHRAIPSCLVRSYNTLYCTVLYWGKKRLCKCIVMVIWRSPGAYEWDSCFARDYDVV